MADKSVRQATILLPHFNCELPILYPEGEEGYVPVRAVCEMLGIRADTCIQRWRHLLLWEEARKLPWRRVGKRTCLVWCLHLGALPFLYCCMDWSSVPPERREQLRQATDEALNVLDQAHQQQRTRSRKLRQLLFPFLVKMAGADQRLQEKALKLSTSLSQFSQKRLDIFVSLGRQLIQEVTTSAKTMLHEMGNSWTVDVVQIDDDGHASDPFDRSETPRQFTVKELADWLEALVS